MVTAMNPLPSTIIHPQVDITQREGATSMDGNEPRGLVNLATVVMGLALIADFAWVISTALHAMK